MSQYNKLAEDPAVAPIVRDWIKSNSPYIVVFGPSGVGKTTLTQSLFAHPDYRRVLYIDADQGDATIEEYTTNTTLCELRSFDKHPAMLVSWVYEQLAYAERAECGAIVVEGFASIHAQMVAAKLAQAKTAEGYDLQRCYIEPTMRTQALMQTCRAIKQSRHAAKKGVPLIVTLNTKQIRKSENPPVYIDIPDWSENLSERMMRGADAFIELTRGPSGVRFMTQQTPDNKFRKLRQPRVAMEVDRQINLSLPGLFALWATTVDKRSKTIDEKLNQPDTTKENQ